MPGDFDLTPDIPRGRQLIQAYGADGFTIAGAHHQGAVLVLPDETRPWAAAGLDDVTLESLEPVLDVEPAPEILVLGTGARFAMVSLDLRQALRARGVIVESMATAAACRTFNVLLAEDRRVVAALIAPQA